MAEADLEEHFTEIYFDDDVIEVPPAVTFSLNTHVPTLFGTFIALVGNCDNTRPVAPITSYFVAPQYWFVVLNSSKK